jgi:hypothetical protein
MLYLPRNLGRGQDGFYIDPNEIALIQDAHGGDNNSCILLKNGEKLYCNKFAYEVCAIVDEYNKAKSANVDKSPEQNPHLFQHTLKAKAIINATVRQLAADLVSQGFQSAWDDAGITKQVDVAKDWRITIIEGYKKLLQENTK